MCCLPDRPVGSAGLAVDLRIANGCVDGDGALQGIVEKGEAHSFRSCQKLYDADMDRCIR